MMISRGGREAAPTFGGHMIISDNVARALLLIHMNGDHFDLKKLLDEPWFKGGVEPHFHRLNRAGYIRSNGFEGEYTLSEEGKQAYQDWYIERGFNLDAQIERWKGYAAVMYHDR
jgi:hypothetical protein